MKKVFKGKGKIGNKDANIIGNYLYKLAEERNKELQPREIVDIAQDKKSVLHKYFTWDDSKAAQEYRIWEARQLLASVVEVRIINNKNKEVRSFWNIKSSDNERAYITFDVMTSNGDYLDQILDDVLEEMDRCRDVINMFKDYRRKLSLKGR